MVFLSELPGVTRMHLITSHCDLTEKSKVLDLSFRQIDKVFFSDRKSKCELNKNPIWLSCNFRNFVIRAFKIDGMNDAKSLKIWKKLNGVV